jgi:hypothetical protein
MKVRLLVPIAGVATAVGAVPVLAGGAVTVSPGRPASVKGHLQGVSPTGPVYAPGASNICVSNACDVTTVNLKLPKAKRGVLTVNAVAGASVIGLTIRVFDAAGNMVGSDTAGGAAIKVTPSQGSQAVVPDLLAGSYRVQLSVGAGTSDFTETFKLAAK